MKYRGFTLGYLQYEKGFSGWVEDGKIYIENSTTYASCPSCIRGLKRLVDNWLVGKTPRSTFTLWAVISKDNHLKVRYDGLVSIFATKRDAKKFIKEYSEDFIRGHKVIRVESQFFKLK